MYSTLSYYYSEIMKCEENESINERNDIEIIIKCQYINIVRNVIW